MKEGKIREAVQEVLRVLGVEVKVEEVRRIRDEVGKDKEIEMVLVRLGSEEQEMEVLRKKRKLKGRKERIMEDWT